MALRTKVAFLVCLFVAWLPVGTGPARAGELIVEGGFETGAFGSTWVHGAYRGGNNNPNLADHTVLLDLPHDGDYSALLGFKYTSPSRDAHAYMYRDVAIPANVSLAALNFKIRMQGYDSGSFDPFIVEIRDTGNNLLERILTLTFTEWNDKFKDTGWISDDNQPPDGFDVSGYAGQTIRIYFDQANLNDNLYETWTYVDAVSLVFKKFVDLFADGNGDDVFGDPDTGLGALSTKSGMAGDTLRYELQVENEGAVGDQYQLTAAVPPGWTAQIDDGTSVHAFPYTTAAVAAGEVKDFTVVVVSPPTAPAGTQDVLVDAVSATQADRFDSATLRATVVDAYYGADLAVNGNGFGVVGDGGSGGFALGEAPWDSALAFDIELINTGDGPTAYTVSFAEQAGLSASIWYGGTRYTAPFTTPVIADGATVSMSLEVEATSPSPGGDYETIVRAAANGDTLKRDTIKALLRLRAPRADIIIAASGDNIYDNTFSGLGGASSNAGEPGAVVSFPLIVQNESSLPDSFELDWVRPQGGWSATIEIDGADRVFPVTTPTFAPNSQALYTLKVTIRSNAAYGSYRSILNLISAVNDQVSESVTATISVSGPGEMDMTIDGEGVDVYGPIGTGLGGTSIHTASPGDTVVFLVGIENNSGANAFDVQWNTPSGWQATLDGQLSPLAGIPEGVYTLEVVVPPTSPGGTFDIIVDGQKTHKRFFMDSVTGRVVVVPAAVVDGLIDGNGDDVFGDTGTGLGGSSSQITAAPASLNFTVELQNQGIQADEYRVTWNSIPLWGATMDGGSSPFTTSTIPAGGADLMTFNVSVPAGAMTGNHAFIIDVVSLSDSTSFESVEAVVSVLGPPRVDLVIDGDGAGVFGPLGSGQGGASLRAVGAGSSYSASLRVLNVGSFPDSFRIEWEVPVGWPAGSVTINDGSSEHTSAFWTTTIPAAQFLDFTVTVQVPAGLVTDGAATIINSWSSRPPNLPESVQLVTQTSAVVRGFVFDDRDHDLTWSPGDVGLDGVLVVVEPGGAGALTGGDGSFAISIPGGATVTVVEHNPSGYVSLSPDTLGPFVANAGDTVTAYYADVPPLRISAGTLRNGLAGGYIDFPHTLEAGTAGQVVLVASNDVGAVTMYLLDENGNGVFDGADRTLVASDTDMDPAAGGGVVSVLLRVFVPVSLQPGLTFHVETTATQTVSGTPVVLSAAATDAVVVVGSAVGVMSLSKAADKSGAVPGEVITYTIRFFNAGVDSIQNVVLFDPISQYVDPLPDGFGPGLDVEWRPSGSPPAPPAYLTFDLADGDECEYSPSERLLRIVLSRNTPFFLAPGESGAFVYRVRVR